MILTYVREPGLEGAVVTQEEPAEGKSLADLLDTARPPLAAALELVAAAADVLTIAGEDRAVHGDLRLQHIKLDGDGSVGIEDFGSGRRSGRAPEEQATAASDVYALGVVLHALLSPSPFGRLPAGAEAHDAAVDGKVAELDLGEVAGEPWADHLRSFVALMLAHDPAQRPAPDEVAEVLDHVGGLCPGSELEVWARRVTISLDGSSGSGRRRRRQERLKSAKQLTRPLKRDRTQTFARRREGADATVAFLRGRLPDEEDAPPPVPPATPAPAPTDWVRMPKEPSAAPSSAPSPPAAPASSSAPAREAGMSVEQMALLGLAGIAALGLGIGLALLLGS